MFYCLNKALRACKLVLENLRVKDNTHLNEMPLKTFVFWGISFFSNASVERSARMLVG
jgi:hypothetical protein